MILNNQEVTKEIRETEKHRGKWQCKLGNSNLWDTAVLRG